MACAARLLRKIRRLVRRGIALLLAQDYDADRDEIEWLLREAEEKLGQAREAVAAALVQEKGLEREVAAALALAQDWRARAAMALGAGREDEARHAIERQLAAERASEQLKAELGRQSQAVACLRSFAHELQIQLDAVRRQREIIQARQQRQDAEAEIRRASRRDGAIRDLNRALARAVEQSQARDAVLEAARELDASAIEAQLTQAQVEAELAALHARLDEPPQ